MAKRPNVELPAYLKHDGKDTIYIDPDVAYPEFLADIKDLGEFEIRVPAPEGGEERIALEYKGPDQYWVEVCYNLAKLDSVFWCSVCRRPAFRRRVIRSKNPNYKARWARDRLPRGRMEIIEQKYGQVPGVPYTGPLSKAEAQVRREARQIFQRLRGAMPRMTMV